MVSRGFAYIGHMFSKGFSIVDVRDPANPKTVNYIEAPFNTWNIHLQTQDNLLLVINAKDMFAAGQFPGRKGILPQARWVKRSAPHQAHPAQSATGQLEYRSMTFPVHMRRASLDSCRSMAAAFIASGTRAAAGPMFRRFSMDSPTTSS